MTKRLVDLDDELLEAARSMSGDASITGTIVVAPAPSWSHWSNSSAGSGPLLHSGAASRLSKDLDDPDVLRGAQR